MSFSEEVFLWALSSRAEDARRFGEIFKPEWLQTPQYRPVLAEIYEFTKKKGIPPSIKVLHEIFKKKDPSTYENRIKRTLDKISNISPPDTSEILFHLDAAKEVAVSWSLKELVTSPAFQKMNESFDGYGQITVIESWLHQFLDRKDDVELDVKQVIDKMIKERTWTAADTRIPTNIKVIDELCGGGIRKGNLAILLAPTGHGKSNALIIMSWMFASVEEKNTLLITNELSAIESVERMASNITNVKLDHIQDDPIEALQGQSKLQRHWSLGRHKKLRIWDTGAREISTDDIEAAVSRYINLYGWAPEVVVIDFMERMRPTARGIKRDQSWNWYGAIAQDLVRLSKKNNWLVWTAGQYNRAGLSRGAAQESSQAQGSIKHLQEAAAVIGMKQLDVTLEDKDKKLLEFVSHKSRHSKKAPAPILVEADFSRMQITDNRRQLGEFTGIEGDDEEDDKMVGGKKKQRPKNI